MDINIIYNEIIEKLKASNNWEEISAIEYSDVGTATGSEVLIATGFYLLSLKYTNPFVYELIHEQIRSYLTYCKDNGLIIN